MLNDVYFLLIIVTLYAAFMTIYADNPITSILFLILLFMTLSVLLILSGFDFLAYIFLTIYIGAIAIIFLIVISVIPIPRYRHLGRRFDTKIIPHSFVVFTLNFIYMHHLRLQLRLEDSLLEEVDSADDDEDDYMDTVEIFSLELYEDYFFLVILLASLLMIAMLAILLLLEIIEVRLRADLRAGIAREVA
jgi:NADH:ubiquinone oxidoreductase subunit 6 (subunit J)